jgi:hypothetical protein
VTILLLKRWDLDVTLYLLLSSIIRLLCFLDTPGGLIAFLDVALNAWTCLFYDGWVASLLILAFTLHWHIRNFSHLATTYYLSILCITYWKGIMHAVHNTQYQMELAFGQFPYSLSLI